MKTFTWTFKRIGLFKSSYSVFDNGQLLATIQDPSFKDPTIIGSHEFQIKDTQKFFFPKIYSVIDPNTNQIIATIEESETDYFLNISKGARHNIGVNINDNPAQTNGLIYQKYNDKMFFADSGKIEIRSDKDVELFLLSLFFVLHLRHWRDVATS